MKRIMSVIIIFSLLFIVKAEEEQTTTPKPEPIAGIYIGGGKVLNTSSEQKSNLDWLYGFFYLGMGYQHDNFGGTIVFGVFPEGLGYTPIFGFEQDPETNKIIPEEGKIARVNVFDANVHYKGKYLDFKIGRWKLAKGTGYFYGFYSGASYKETAWYSNGYRKNQLELSKTIQGFHTAFSIAVNDRKFDKASLHGLVSYSVEEIIKFSFSYGGNIFDKISDDNAVIVNDMDLCINATPVQTVKDFTLFFDVGFTDIGAEDPTGKKLDTQFPVSLGFTIPTNNIMSKVQCEMEILSDRKDSKGDDAPFLFGVHANKAFLKHFNVEGGLCANGSLDNIIFELGMDSWF